MTNPINNIRTQQTKELLTQMDSVLKEWETKRNEFSLALDALSLEQIYRDIDRARRQFGSELFFVVVFGPLKAGKSTLTNALAGEYVSPAGFGKETTRRPSFVISAEKDGIDQYISKDSEINSFLSQIRKNNGDVKNKEVSKKIQEAFDTVVDYLRGIWDKNDLEGKIDIKTTPLNIKNLEDKLTGDIDPEPLLTVIRCNGGHLLRHNVAIVDMPGLDGNYSNWEKDPIHEWVVQRADFFLFCQSSVAAWNVETCKFVKKVIGNSTRPPIWLIQNILDACYWRSPETRFKDEEKQREEGRQLIIENLKEAPRHVLGVNLGKAWDGKNKAYNDAGKTNDVETVIKKRKEWLESSGFIEFESGLTEALISEKDSIKEMNCLEYLRQQRVSATNKLNESIRGIKELRESYEHKRNRLADVAKIIMAMNYRDKWEDPIRGKIDTIATKAQDHWISDVNVRIDQIKGTTHAFAREATDINNDLKFISLELSSRASTYFSKSQLFPDYLESASWHCENVEQGNITKCNKILDNIGFRELPFPPGPTTEDLPFISEESFTQSILSKDKAWGFLWETKREPKIAQGHDEIVRREWVHQIKERRDSWVNRLHIEHFSTYCEKRRKFLLTAIEQLINDVNIEATPREKAANIMEGIISQMKKSLNNLEIPLENAIESVTKRKERPDEKGQGV